MTNLYSSKQALYCPYIGKKNDRETILGYPSSGNYCHKYYPPVVPSTANQREYCLTPQFTACPSFQPSISKKRPEKMISQQSCQPKRQQITRSTVLLMVIIALILLLIMLFFPDKDKASHSFCIWFIPTGRRLIFRVKSAPNDSGSSAWESLVS